MSKKGINVKYSIITDKCKNRRCTNASTRHCCSMAKRLFKRFTYRQQLRKVSPQFGSRLVNQILSRKNQRVFIGSRFLKRSSRKRINLSPKFSILFGAQFFQAQQVDFTRICTVVYRTVPYPHKAQLVPSGFPAYCFAQVLSNKAILKSTGSFIFNLTYPVGFLPLVCVPSNMPTWSPMSRR